MNEHVGRVGKPTGLSQAEPQEGLGPSGFDPSRKWLHRYAHMKSDGAILAAAKAIAPVILETFDGYRYGSVDWERLPRGDKAVLEVIAKQALLAADGYAFARYRDSDGSPKGGDACGSVHDSAGLQGIARKPAQ